MKLQRRCSLVTIHSVLAVSTLLAQSPGTIRLNQVGFYPAAPKIAIVRDSGGIPFAVISASSADTVFRGTLSATQTWSYSNESVSRADFTDLRTPGTYRLVLPGTAASYPFAIRSHVHEQLAIGALRGFYYQRVSTPLLPEHAGTWARASGHPDTSVLVHASAATAQRPAGTRIRSSAGWYDAGDYNKYIVNSGISTYSVLAAYEHFPGFCDHLKTGIPESGNILPDILDEALWNLRWMLSMQDPDDGGVYHKLTNAKFDGFIMPAQATTLRYVVKKSTAAALDFAAVLAQAARITKTFSTPLPGFSDSCLQASLRAWRWARRNPAIYYNQTQMNTQFAPQIETGEYGDGYVGDELDWAAAELFVTTGQDSFLAVGNPLSSPSASIPSWPDVRTLGLYTFARHRQAIAGTIDSNAVRSRLVNLANSLVNTMNSSAYRVAMGAQSWDFVWGSNAVAANQGMALLVAYNLTGNTSYLYTALSNLDYLLGRNGTTYCFVTGFGSHPPLYIHHRVSAADNIVNPVPGLLAGGPNPRKEDGVTTYPSSLPALAYTDDVNSYASNEICINWNAPLVYLAVGLEALLSPDGMPTSAPQGQLRAPEPDSFGLSQNYPNPFNPTTVIRARWPVDGHVKLVVCDVLGREVVTLADGRYPAGQFAFRLDGSALASGVYLCRLTAADFVQTRKMVLAR